MLIVVAKSENKIMRSKVVVYWFYGSTGNVVKFFYHIVFITET
jgi:hypothetical protein